MFLSVQNKKVEQEYLPHYPTGENVRIKIWPQTEEAVHGVEGRSSEAFYPHKTELETA